MSDLLTLQAKKNKTNAKPSVGGFALERRNKPDGRGDRASPDPLTLQAYFDEGFPSMRNMFFL